MVFLNSCQFSRGSVFGLLVIVSLDLNDLQEAASYSELNIFANNVAFYHYHTVQ